MKNYKYLFLVLCCFLFFAKSFADSKCFSSAQTLSRLLDETKPDGIAQPLSDDTISQVYKSKPNPLYQYKVSINFTSTDPTPSFSPLERMDQLYQTSDLGIIPQRPKGYKFDPPLQTEFQITDSNKFYQAIVDKVNSSTPDNLNEVYLASGGMNHVYLTHTNSLPSGIVPGTPEHLKWTMEFGENVMVKKAYKKSDASGLIEGARTKSRDDAFYQLADALTQKVTLDSKPFIRVAKGDLLQGTQEFVTGPTVLELRRAEEMLRYPDKVFSTKSTIKSKDQALQILQEAGFVKNGVPDLDEVSRQLASVEVFYKETHAVGRELGVQYFPDITLMNVYRDEIKLIPSPVQLPKTVPLKPVDQAAATLSQKAQELYVQPEAPRLIPPPLTRQSALPAPQQVTPQDMRKNYGAIGFDFNHGRNVIWSAKEKMFVIIDI